MEEDNYTVNDNKVNQEFKIELEEEIALISLIDFTERILSSCIPWYLINIQVKG